MQTENLIVRYLKMEDLDGFFSVISCDKNLEDMPLIKDRQDAKQKLEELVSQTKNGQNYAFALISKSSHQFAGFIQLNLTGKDSGELSCVMHPDFWNKGLGSEGMLLIERFALEKLKLTKLRGVCTAFNSSCTSLFKYVLGFDYVTTEFIDGKDYVIFEKKVQTPTNDDTYMHKLEAQYIRKKNK